MWYIKNEEGLYYAGYTNGCVIWKSHWSRAYYSGDMGYLHGVVDTLTEVIGLEGLTVEWEDE